MMKKILYILMSGILGTVLISCAGDPEYKIENLSTIKAKVSYNSNKESFKICMDDVKNDDGANSINYQDISNIGDFSRDGDKYSNFCKVLYKSGGVDQTILIPKSFSVVDYRNGKKFYTNNYTKEITYNVYSGGSAYNNGNYIYSSTAFKTFKVSSGTILGTLTLDDN